MANLVYPKFKNALLNGDVDMDAVTIQCVLVDLADYTYNAAHEFLTDLPAAARVAQVGLANPNVGVIADGVFDGDDVVFNTVSGDEAEAVVLYVDTGVEGTSRLVGFIDTAPGLPITPNGGNIPINWNASGIFQIQGN